MCDRVKEKVAAEAKQKKQSSFESYTSILLDTDDVPLMDDLTPVDDLSLSQMWRQSIPEDHNGTIPPNRGSVVSNIYQSHQVLSTSLPSKPLSSLSPDVFHIRAPLVSWENFMTPDGSVETVFDSSNGSLLESRE